MSSQGNTSSEKSSRIRKPDLVFGIVGAVGTDLDLVVDYLGDLLKKANYKRETIQLSDFLNHIKGLKTQLESDYEEKRIDTHMTAGNELRRRLDDESALALFAIVKIKDIREACQDGKPRAYVIKSLKNTEEVKKLRSIYKDNFWTVSVYSKREERLKSLATKIAKSYSTTVVDDYNDDAERLITRDEHEAASHGQNVRDTFPEGDVFIDASDQSEMEQSLKRFIDMIFGDPFHTPNREENGMFHAYANSLRSSSLSRQVGASITNTDGDILSTGTNEVPKFGGGPYWSEDNRDEREFNRRIDTNDRKKKDILLDVIEMFQTIGIISNSTSADKLFSKVAESVEYSRLKIMDLIEFSREVHAEMAALADTSKRGVSVKDTTMYVTTFPCHICAKHIVASGISKVVYVHPYPKSLAQELFSDSITVDKEPSDGNPRVIFTPFTGIAPKRFLDLFRMTKRKDESTKEMMRWSIDSSKPRYEHKHDIYHEKKEIHRLKHRMKKCGLG